MRRTLYLTILLAATTAVFGCGSNDPVVPDSLQTEDGSTGGRSNNQENANNPTDDAETEVSESISFSDSAYFVDQFFGNVSEEEKAVSLLNQSSSSFSGPNSVVYDLESESNSPSQQLFASYRTVQFITNSDESNRVNPDAIDKSRASMLQIIDKETGEVILTYVIAAVKTSRPTGRIGRLVLGEDPGTVLLRVENEKFYLPGPQTDTHNTGVPAEVVQLAHLTDPATSAKTGFLRLSTLQASTHPFIQDGFSLQKFASGSKAFSAISYSMVRNSEFSMVE